MLAIWNAKVDEEIEVIQRRCHAEALGVQK
jgi:hypothetical protein